MGTGRGLERTPGPPLYPPLSQYRRLKETYEVPKYLSLKMLSTDGSEPLASEVIGTDPYL